MKADCSNIKSDISSQNLNILNIKSDISTMNKNISLINNNISSIKSDCSTMKSDISSNNSNISYIKTDISSMKSDCSSMKSNFLSINTDISNIKSNVTSINNDNSSMKSQCGTIKANVLSINSNINYLQSEFSELKKLLLLLVQDKQQISSFNKKEQKELNNNLIQSNNLAQNLNKNEENKLNNINKIPLKSKEKEENILSDKNNNIPIIYNNSEINNIQKYNNNIINNNSNKNNNKNNIENKLSDKNIIINEKISNPDFQNINVINIKNGEGKKFKAEKKEYSEKIVTISMEGKNVSIKINMNTSLNQFKSLVKEHFQIDDNTIIYYLNKFAVKKLIKNEYDFKNSLIEKTPIYYFSNEKNKEKIFIKPESNNNLNSIKKVSYIQPAQNEIFEQYNANKNNTFIKPEINNNNKTNQIIDIKQNKSENITVLKILTSLL